MERSVLMSNNCFHNFIFRIKMQINFPEIAVAISQLTSFNFLSSSKTKSIRFVNELLKPIHKN